MNDTTKLFLIDGMAVVYRAHFAMIRNPAINSQGFNTSPVLGYLNTILDVINRWSPTHLAVAFDTSEPTFRHEAYPEYKAQRQKMPEDLSLALPYVFKITEAMNIPVLRYPGHEADDVIGTFARIATEQGLETYMVTPDKDFAQLVSEHVKILKPSRDGICELGMKEILEDWGVERIEQVVDMLGMMGDSSDNIPGIPGIGPKTAKKLIAEFGSLEGVLANTDKLKGKQKEKVEENAELARLSRRLVTINTEVELKHSFDELKLGEANREALAPLLVELELNTLGKRLLGDDFDATAKLNMGPLETIKDIELVVELVDTDDKIKAFIEELSKQKAFCFDIETTGKDARHTDIVGIGFSWEPGRSWYVPFPDEGLFSMMQIEPFKPVFENPAIGKVGHNLKFDITVLRSKEVKIAGELFDTMLAQYVIDPEDNQKMDYLAQKYLQYDPITYDDLTRAGEMQLRMLDVKKVARYCCEDVDVTLRLRAALEPVLKEMKLEKVFGFECALVPALIEMEFTGIKLDIIALRDYSKELASELLGCEKRIYELAGQHFNIGSPKQVGEILFDVLKLSDKPKKTRTGQYKANEQVIQQLVGKHEIAEQILIYRQIRKLRDTYVDQLPTFAASDGRVHTHYNQAVTVTGRMASDKPNMQNIPIRSERGREIRKAFVPSDDKHTLLSADYSQIELRIIAQYSQCEELIDAFCRRQDVHSTTAAHVFGVELDAVTSEMRSKAKMVNFGLAYGMTVFGLAQRLSISRTESKAIIDQYFNAFPGIKGYMDGTIEFAREHGYVETMLGRRRYLRDIKSRNGTARQGAERNAINMPIQGTSADMIKIAMVNIHREMEKRGLQSRMLLQIHDELVFDVVLEEEEEMRELVYDKMVNAIPMAVPIEVEMGTGADWLEAH